MIRLPVVAGRYYPEAAPELEALIKTMVDDNAIKENVLGMVVPHAGYPFSGPVVGACLSRINMADTFIIIGPNHTGRGKPFSIMTDGKWLTPFGAVDIDRELAKKLVATSKFLREDDEAHRLEHSVEVQLPFLQYFKKDVKFVPIITTLSNIEAHRQIGKEIAKAIKDTKRNAIIMVSSDMTHYEPHEEAKIKDELAIRAMLDLNEYELAKRIEGMNITMCGYAPALSLLAAMKEMDGTRAELVKYQTSGDTTGDFDSVVGYAGILFKEMSPIVKLARQTVETYIKEDKIIEPPPELTPEMKEKAGVFVSIHKKGELRGCIGTFGPSEDNVAKEIITNAISSSTRDPRFDSVVADELKDLDYSVDVLSTPEPVESIEQLDPKKYGAIVEAGWRRGLLLPDLEGVDTAEQQVDICRQKAGISSKEEIKLYRFEVKRYR
ncbi:MAG: AmmeMemoRadiSam system protein B [Dehalococcoidales bacterium]|nr:AmmeMemoRadiSam system protein B [Dehalococcoidales bacterium]